MLLLTNATITKSSVVRGDTLTVDEFIEVLWDQYKQHQRATLPWRIPREDGTFNPYHILVSEIMLQQTQVSRVIPKYEAFLTVFPTMDTLANAEFKQVLQLWSGLGYTRRAKYLHDIAKQLASVEFPTTIDALSAFKGIGENTAAAILTYTYNKPVVFIETNVRTVFLYHFYPKQDTVDDKQIRESVGLVIDALQPGEYRDFYWALMDYGTHLKALGVRNNAQSRHYAKQSTFIGSRRQVRGKVMQYMAEHAHNTIMFPELVASVADERLLGVLHDLEKEGLLSVTDQTISL